MAQKRKEPAGEQVLRQWLDRDLGAAADAGELDKAYEVDELIARMSDVITAGMNPILIGEPGVGKTAVLHELVRRTRAQGGPAALRERRVLGLSLRKRAAALRKNETLGEAFTALVEALIELGGEVVPVFADMHVAARQHLGPQLALLAVRLGAPVLGEGEATAVRAMIEDDPELEHYFVALPVEEPDLEVTARILRAWRDDRAQKPPRIDDEALEAALTLTHRFLPRIRQPRKSIELLMQVRSLAKRGSTVGAEQVMDRFHQAYRVPRFLVDPKAPFDLDAVLRSFRQRLLGQLHAVQTLVRTVGTIKAGLSDPRRPFGVFLFVGPTGVGKTHLAQLLAQHLFGSRDRLVRLNMADFQAPGDAYSLFGNPDAYDVRGQRGLLTARLLGHPFAVVLLDEFEKASRQVHDRFFQLVDEGEFINGLGETISCRSLIFIATSNAGSEVYRARSIGFAVTQDVAELEHELERRLQQTFRVEFLNRFDQIVHFHPLGRSDIRTIAQREIEQLAERGGLKGPGYLLEVDEDLLDWLTAHGYDPLHGARFLRRAIERHVTTALAEAIVRGELPPGSKLALRVRAGRVVASVVEAARPPEAEPRPVSLPQGRGEKVKAMDRAAVVREAAALVARAKPLLAGLEAQRDEASKLLELVSAEELWDEPEQARELLGRYRDLDLRVQTGTRHAEPILWLEELARHAAQQPRRTPELARSLTRAARALRDWEERRSEEGPSAVWLVLRDVDPMHGGERWLEELAQMEMAWCRRLGLAAELAAGGTTDEQLSRLVLDVEGPGAMSYLAMEQGLHRLNRPSEPDLRVRVDVIAKGPAPVSDRPPPSVRAQPGPLGLTVRCRGRLVVEERGLVVELGAQSSETLAHLLADLEAALAREGELPVARLYADSGAGARDPRTGAVVARYKDVLHGKLDALLDGWREQPVSR